MASMAERPHKSAVFRILCRSWILQMQEQRRARVGGQIQNRPRIMILLATSGLEVGLEGGRDGSALETRTHAHADRALRAGHSSEHGHDPPPGGMPWGRGAYHRAGWIPNLRPRIPPCRHGLPGSS